MSTYTAAFAEIYDDIFPPSDEPVEAQALRSLLPGGRGRVLELGAGTGRLAIPLARSGCSVIAVENASAMSERLLAKIVPGDDLTVIAQDMREELPDGPFDLVACILGGIACLASAAERAAVIAAAAERLAPGGVVVIETYNGPAIRAEHGDEAERRVELPYPHAGAVLSSRLRLTGDDRWQVDHDWSRRGNSVRVHEDVALIDPDELDEAGRAAGLQPIARYATWHGEPYVRESSPMVISVWRRGQ